MRNQVQSQDDFLSVTRLGMVEGLWMHFAFSGSRALSRTYIRADYQDQVIRQAAFGYLGMSRTVQSWSAFLGMTSTLQNGFVGDLREFMFYQGYITEQQVSQVKNMHVLWDFRLLAYYRL